MNEYTCSMTRNVIRLVGKTGELANRVKENTLNYFENHLADYILNRGGWVSGCDKQNILGVVFPFV